ncbi:MAG: DUF3427 domain-containing protein [Acidobacteriota bacterium]
MDYKNIPWRSGKFEEEALTAAVATRARAANALEQYRRRGGRRALGFCVSQRHADFMADFFLGQGLRAVAVHAGENSAPRAASLEALSAGHLDIVFAVDMFNEGVDIPTLDTVMMLRPTASRILWLQQFGRGLRKAENKERLTVIDYIGNHRAFLLGTQTLLGLGTARSEVLHALEQLKAGEFELPPGCEVTYDLATIDILMALTRASGGDALKEHYEEFRELHGVRPTASEMYHDGYNPRSARRIYDSWLRFVRSMGHLDQPQQLALKEAAGLLDSLEVTEMTRGHKMLTLLAMLNAGRFPGEIAVADLAKGFKRLATRNPHLTRECGGDLYDDASLQGMLERNPIAAWTGGLGTGGVSYFAYDREVFKTTISVSDEAREPLRELVREVADWRLAEYLDRPVSVGPGGPSTAIECKVSHADGRPMLFLPSRDERSDIPSGWANVVADAEPYEANFVKVAVNVLRKPGSDENELPGILRRWFGPDAGRPGTVHHAVFERRGDTIYLAPIGKRASALEVWRAYSREEIPGLFGLDFSRAIWNAGFVVQAGHMFLLVTLEKRGKQETHQYEDRFLTTDSFQWQSQNRTSQASLHGQNIRHHEERGIDVHLFIRAQSKTPHGRAAPFVYCGDVDFVSWQGEQPITVTWQLREAVPEHLWERLGGATGDRSPE